ncbi:MAG: hypothetical protein WCI41_01930 [bacterium]
MFNSVFGFALSVLYFLSPYAATILLGYFAWKMWVHYIRQDFISGIDWVMLEIIPPRDVERSPKGMELFFTNALYHWSEKGGMEEYWQGAVWFWYSLEIASIDGQVHFYIRTPSRIKDLIETQMYAQYPQAQVKITEDYTAAIDAITPEGEWNLWGCEFKLRKPEAYPVKTYVDFGLDKDPKEEFKVDPISPVIELFGSIQKGEQMWMQIVITPSKKKYKSHHGGYHDWVEEAKAQLDKVLKPFTSQKLSLDKSVTTEIRSPAYLDPVIKGINGKMTKLGFDTGIRVCYVAKKEIFPLGTRTNNSRNIRLIFRQYANPFLNEFWRHNATQGDAYSGFFTASKNTVRILANRMLIEYKERAFFHLPMRHHLYNKHTIFWPLSIFLRPYFHPETVVLNVEELATIWHFPGQILKVPTLERIESKEAAPPTNLPL